MYLAGPGSGGADPDAKYVLWGGANDMQDAIALMDDPDEYVWWYGPSDHGGAQDYRESRQLDPTPSAPPTTEGMGDDDRKVVFVQKGIC